MTHFKKKNNLLHLFNSLKICLKLALIKYTEEI